MAERGDRNYSLAIQENILIYKPDQGHKPIIDEQGLVFIWLMTNEVW